MLKLFHPRSLLVDVMHADDENVVHERPEKTGARMPSAQRIFLIVN